MGPMYRMNRFGTQAYFIRKFSGIPMAYGICMTHVWWLVSQNIPKADGSKTPKLAPEKRQNQIFSRTLSSWLLKMRNSFFAPRLLGWGTHWNLSAVSSCAKCMQITYFMSLAVRLIRFEDNIPQSMVVMIEFRLSAVLDKRLAKVSLKVDAATTTCLCDAVSLGHKFWVLELHLSSRYVQWRVATSHLLKTPPPSSWCTPFFLHVIVQIERYVGVSDYNCFCALPICVLGHLIPLPTPKQLREPRLHVSP